MDSVKKIALSLLLVCAGCAAQSGAFIGGGAAITPPTGSVTPAAWTQLASLPTLVTTLGDNQNIYAPGDGNIYVSVGVGSFPSQVNHIFVAAETCVTTGGSCWKDITTSSLSGSGTEGSIHMIGLMANGTAMACASNGSTLADCWTWNGSTSSPAWTLVSGWTGSSTSFIYNITNDQAGNTYFSPAYSGDVWRNGGSGSTTFTKILTNWYVSIGQTAGGIYALHDYTINGVENLCGGGEGEMDCFVLSSFPASWTALLTAGSGCTGNLWGMDASAATIIALRKCDVGGDAVNQVSKSNFAVTLVTAAGGGYEPYMDSNAVPTIHFMNGSTWALGSLASSVNFIIYSTNNGTAWTPFPSGYCPSGTLSFPSTSTVRIAATAHYVYVPCTISSAPAISQYGPL